MQLGYQGLMAVPWHLGMNRTQLLVQQAQTSGKNTPLQLSFVLGLLRAGICWSGKDCSSLQRYLNFVLYGDNC